ncbi:MAG: hypothetical protein DRJ42_23370 [Deltaproteobacteria bacterium]|nr:MAG: hypothetical protein DRJ42_23370 [Deltaproteobacteria bacterium]
MDRAELSKIGFNSSVQGDGYKLMVQTEVLEKEQVMIRTTVLDRGIVQSRENRPCPEASGLDEVRELAKVQHERILETVKQSAG